LIGATFARAIVISAAVAGALAPVACFAEGAPALPEKATRELPAALLSLLAQKKMPRLSPILLRIFKEESELEVWKQTAAGRFELLKLYPDLPLVGRARAEAARGRLSGARGLLCHHAKADEPEFQLLSGHQHGLSQCLRRGE
jgi:murein L,D-transpeptidase YafK